MHVLMSAYSARYTNPLTVPYTIYASLNCAFLKMVFASDEVCHVLCELRLTHLLSSKIKMAVHCLQAISKALQGLLKRKVYAAMIKILPSASTSSFYECCEWHEADMLLYCSQGVQGYAILDKAGVPIQSSFEVCRALRISSACSAKQHLPCCSMHLRAVQASLADAYSICLIAVMTDVPAPLLFHAACSRTDIRRPCATTCVPSR